MRRFEMRRLASWFREVKIRRSDSLFGPLTYTLIFVLCSLSAPKEMIAQDIPPKEKTENEKPSDTHQEQVKKTSHPQDERPQAPIPTQDDIGGPAPLFTTLYPKGSEEEDKQKCKALNGRWTSAKGGLLGCLVKGLKEGRWLLKEGEFVQGLMNFHENKPHGQLWGFSLEGKAIELLSYDMGKRSGAHRKWGPGGQLKLSERYDNDQRHGPSFEWYTRSCIPAHRGAYQFGTKEGPWITWYPTGAPNQKGSYVDGKPHGQWSYFHQEGNKIREGLLENGVETGIWKEWLHTGQKWRDVTYREGVRQGEDELACAAEGGDWVVDYKERSESCIRHGFQTIIALKTYYPSGALARREPYTLEGENTGEVRVYHPSGELLTQGQVVGGRPEGEFTYLSISGEPMGDPSYILQGTGEWTAYHHTGKVSERGRWELGKQVGDWKTFHDHGALESVTHFNIDGLREGEHKRYYRDGTIESEGLFANNARQGLWRFYYTNGQVAVEAGFVNSARSGPWREWHWLSSPKVEGEFANNQRSGTWREYHNNGVISGTGAYSQGKKEGTWSQHWYSGSKWRDLDFTSGVSDDADESQCSSLNGEWKADLKERFAGCEVCRVSVDLGQKNVKTGVWKWWHPNGELEREGRFEEDSAHGLWSEYNRKGELTLSGEYDHGKRTGIWRGYYPSGQRQYEGRFDEQGREEGEWLTYYDGGSKESQGTYTSGQRLGLWIWWDKAGSLAQVGEYKQSEEESPIDQVKKDKDKEREHDDAKDQPSLEKELSSERVDLWISWHPKCKMRTLGRYQAGERNGLWRWWRENGEGWRSERYLKGKSEERGDPPLTLKEELSKQLERVCLAANSDRIGSQRDLDSWFLRLSDHLKILEEVIPQTETGPSLPQKNQHLDKGESPSVDLER